MYSVSNPIPYPVKVLLVAAPCMMAAMFLNRMDLWAIVMLLILPAWLIGLGKKK